MNSLIGILAVLACAASLSVQQSAGATEGGFAASVIELTGKCLVRDNESATPRRMKQGDGLRAGQQVSCARDSTLKILFERTRADKPISQRFPNWYTVPNPAPAESQPLKKNGATRIAKDSETQKDRASHEATADRATAGDPRLWTERAERERAVTESARMERAARERADLETAELARAANAEKDNLFSRNLRVYSAQRDLFFYLLRTFDVLENEVVSSYDNGDKARLEILTAPNFYHMFSDGKSVNKKEWLERLPDLPGVYLSLNGLKVTPLQSDSVIVTYNALVLTERDGKDVYANIGVTSVWVFDGKTWLIAFRQESQR